MNHDWKVYLEGILLEARAGKLDEAIVTAQEAVNMHPGTGRLWALCIQLHHKSEKSCKIQPSMFRYSSRRQHLSASRIMTHKAMAEVPKSGEVWCEHGRCLLNPLQVDSFDLAKAFRALNFAINFTPQYGDTFIEYLRAEMLSTCILPVVCQAVGLDCCAIAQRFLCCDEDSDLTHFMQSKSFSNNGDGKDPKKMAQTIMRIHHLEYESSCWSTLNSAEYPNLFRR
jgi:hypothetical protein